MNRRFNAVIAAAAICFSLLSACSSSSAGNPSAAASTSSAASSASDPNVLTIGSSSDILTTDPQNQDQTNTMELFDSIASRLFKRDQNMKLINDLATGYKTLNDTTWQFTIRKDAQFSNGDPLTSADVKYTLDRVSKDQSLVDYTYFKCITNVKILDDYTFTITTNVARPDLRALLAMGGSEILPSKYITKNSMDAFKKTPVTSGPYMLKEWVPDDHYTLVPNPKYYGTKAKWEKVTYRIIPEASTRVSELLTGGVDAIDNVPSNEWDRVSQNTAGSGTSLVYGETSRVMLLVMRCTDGWATADPRVREAIELAIDKDAICKTLLKGAGTPTRTRIGSGVTGFDADLFGSKNANLYNVAQAKQLLSEAGYGEGKKTLTLNFTASKGRYLMDGEMAQMIAAYLQNVGIKVNLNLVDSTVLSNVWAQKQNKEILMMGLSDGEYDGIYDLQHYGDKARGAGMTDYNSPEAQALYQKALVNMNEESRLDQLRQIQVIAANDRPHIDICQVKAIFGVSKRLKFSPRMDSVIMPNEVTPA